MGFTFALAGCFNKDNNEDKVTDLADVDFTLTPCEERDNYAQLSEGEKAACREKFAAESPIVQAKVDEANHNISEYIKEIKSGDIKLDYSSWRRFFSSEDNRFTLDCSRHELRMTTTNSVSLKDSYVLSPNAVMLYAKLHSYPADVQFPYIYATQDIKDYVVEKCGPYQSALTGKTPPTAATTPVESESKSAPKPVISTPDDASR